MQFCLVQRVCGFKGLAENLRLWDYDGPLIDGGKVGGKWCMGYGQWVIMSIMGQIVRLEDLRTVDQRVVQNI